MREFLDNPTDQSLQRLDQPITNLDRKILRGNQQT